MTESIKANAEITPQAIRAQLSRIVLSETFARSTRMCRFLEFIVEETLAGRADELGEYGIGVAVFDRGDDFEPGLDPIVRNDARRLRFKLLEYYTKFSGSPDGHVRIEIPKGAYVPAFMPLTAREEESSPRSHGAQRLAVLPFEVLSAAPESASYGRALCMSLTASLTNVNGVEAIAHGYLREQPIRETASELHLSHVIHGSVLKADGRCRVVVNLIHIENGTQLWAREYDFDDVEMMTAQSEITRTVFSEVSRRLGGPRTQTPRLALVA